MKAVVYRTTGPADEVLRVEDVEDPEPGPGEVRVRIEVSGVNPRDVKERSGAVPSAGSGPWTPHHDGAGTVDAVGEGVDPGRVGQRVWVLFGAVGGRAGTAAELAVVPAGNAVELPPSAPVELGATLGIPAVTAAVCLGDPAELAGRTVLVAGGAGAVGRSAVALAHAAGARVVATVSGAGRKAELARAAGADVVLDRRDPDLPGRLRAVTDRVDRVVELALGANLDTDLVAAGPGTEIVVYANEPDDPPLPVRRLMVAQARLRFVLVFGVPRPELDRAVAQVAAAVAAGALPPPPTVAFDLADVAAAHARVEAGSVERVLLRS